MNSKPNLMMVSIIGAVALMGGVLFVTIAHSDDASKIGPTQILPQLTGPYEQVTELVSVPVLLPTEVPSLGTDFWLTEYETGSDQYNLSIDLGSDCSGSGFCTRGSIGGEIVTETTETVSEVHAYLEDYLDDPERPRSPEPMGLVDLMGGREGVFVPWVATAQCTEARVYWEQPSASGEETYRYYVGIECGDRAEVIELANNVIANTEGF